MGFLDRMRAGARGEIPAEGLAAYARAGGDAYDLIDSLPPAGIARAAAWNAFVLQTLADNLVTSSETPGFVAPETAEFARVLYELVGNWLSRARQAASGPAYRLDVYLPQALPRPPHTKLGSAKQLAATKTALEAAQARLASDLNALSGPHDELDVVMTAVHASVDYADRLWTRDPDDDLRRTLAAALWKGIEDAYRLGQQLALPDLLEHGTETTRTLAPSALRFALPGEQGFDPWCLTDPIRLRRLQYDRSAADKVNRLWKNDDHPERTLAVRAEIADALEGGAVSYLPADGFDQLYRLADRCPWPGVMYATSPVLIGGESIGAGDRFVFVVGGERDDFHRAVVTMPAAAYKSYLDSLGSFEEHYSLGQILREVAKAGLPVNRIRPRG